MDLSRAGHTGLAGMVVRGPCRLLSIIVLYCSLACTAAGAAERRYDIDIPAGDARTSLNLFAKQVDIPLLYRNQDLLDIRTNRVRGVYGIQEALDILLRDTGIRGMINQSGVLSIVMAGAEQPAPQPPQPKSLVARLTEFLLGDSVAAARSGKPPMEPEQGAPRSRVLEEIRVTGSRVAGYGVTTPTPVTAISHDDLENISPTTVIDALVQLPQFLNSDTPQSQNYSSSGPAGASRINLRGIGTQRTLTLLNGRRIVPSTRTGEVNISLLPQTPVKRIDIVTGGASAVYGSDAVSGVVNLLLDTGYNGLTGYLEGGSTGLRDNASVETGFMWGRPFGDSTHLVVSGEYFEAAGIEGYYDRNWFDSWSAITNPDPAGPGEVIVPHVHSTLYTYGGLITGGPLQGIQFNPQGEPVPFRAGDYVSSITQAGGSGIDPGVDTYILPDQQRYNVFSHLDYRLNENISLYLEGLYSHSETAFEKVPVYMAQPWEATIYIDNAFLPESLRSQMTALGIDSFPFGRVASDADLGAGAVTNANDMTMLSLGFNASLGQLQVNGYYQYGRNMARLQYVHTARLDRLYRALDAVRDPASGRIVCRSTLSFPDDGCVPADMFGAGAPSRAAIDWITEGYAEQKQLIEQHIAEVSLQKNLATSWAGQLNLVAGMGLRQDSLDNVPLTRPRTLLNEVVPPAALAGYRGLPEPYEYSGVFERTVVHPTSRISGSYRVWELFGESIVPLYESAGSGRKLDLNLALRYADYQGSGGIMAWKAGLEWQILEDLKLRWTRSRDVRAGTLAERFDYTSRGAGIRDPMHPEVGPYAIKQVQGGNPLVDPEKADTDTFGVIYRPYWLDGLSISADYYDIKISDAIALPGAQYIVDECQAGSSYHCALIHRNTVTGLIDVVDNIFQNIDEVRTRGVDIEVNYRTPIRLFGGGETLAVRGFASYIGEASTTIAGASRIDRAGQTGLEGGAPDWQFNLGLGYTRGPLSVYLLERYINEGTYNSAWGAADIIDNSVDPAWYTNLRVAYRLEIPRGGLTLFAHINNLFDADPPLAPDWRFSGSIHTNETLFDVLGRRFTAGMKFSF